MPQRAWLNLQKRAAFECAACSGPAQSALAIISFDRLLPAEILLPAETLPEKALVEPLIQSSKEDIILTLHLHELDISDKLERQKKAKADRAAAKEPRAMELDQAPTREVLSQVVREMVAREMAKEVAKQCKQANVQTRRKVQFESKQHSRSKSQAARTASRAMAAVALKLESKAEPAANPGTLATHSADCVDSSLKDTDANAAQYEAATEACYQRKGDVIFFPCSGFVTCYRNGMHLSGALNLPSV